MEMNHTQPTTVRQPSCVRNNGKVAIGNDLIFEWVVYTDIGWQPISMLSKDVLKDIWRKMDYSPIFSAEIINYVHAQLHKPA
jgi:hypothetical protein